MRKTLILTVLILVAVSLFATVSVVPPESEGFQIPGWLAPVIATLLGVFGIAGIAWWSKVQKFMSKLAGLLKEIYELTTELSNLDPSNTASIQEVFTEITDIVKYLKNWKLNDSFKAIDKVSGHVKKAKTRIMSVRHD